ncbi:hypothetical protein TGPRC2_427360 [Toxoplasma gondii TgCatPRC2]|uniref:Uncharacterized protein n=2 Tax=Toxoplasma gondii TaxID=5811 RepID=A0A151GZG0_TOXGO|nr:hypothetical protein TGPRC2_427360 [Toxoplasma gondii TgCatPRC2]
MDRRGCAGTVLLGQATDEVIKQQLADLLGPKNSFTPQLLQLFNRKVKKARRPVAASVEEDEEEDEDFRQLDDEDEDDDDDDLEEDAAPPGCDMQLYENVLELRDIKLETEMKATALKKEFEELKKEQVKQTGLEKVHAERVQQTQKDIQKYQREKQQRANQIRQIVPVTASQIQCLYTEDLPEQEDMTPPAIRLPADLKNEVVFTRSAFARLRQRIKDLRVETEAARAEYRDLTRSFAVSQREKKQTMKVIEQLKQKFENVQLLRFGAGVSLEQLERAAAAVAAEKEQKLNRESMEDKGPATLEAQVISEKRKTIEELSSTRAALLQQNTKLLKTVASLKASDILLRQSLDNGGGTTATALNKDGLTDVHRARKAAKLKEVLKLQVKEIETLKKEIGLFKLKGTNNRQMLASENSRGKTGSTVQQ